MKISVIARLHRTRISGFSLMQTLLYQFKGGTPLWRNLKCSRYMQQTLWQTVATYGVENNFKLYQLDNMVGVVVVDYDLRK